MAPESAPQPTGVRRFESDWQPTVVGECGECQWCTETTSGECPHRYACCRNCPRCNPPDFHDALSAPPQSAEPEGGTDAR